MNTATITPQELAQAEAHRPGTEAYSPHCSVCGVPQPEPPTFTHYAHNTCSQGCARTAALVEAINGWRLAAMPTWRIQPAKPEDFQGHTVKVDGKTATITDARSPQTHHPKVP